MVLRRQDSRSATGLQVISRIDLHPTSRPTTLAAMTQPFDIVGYTYQADNYCKVCTIQRMISQRKAAPAALELPAEEALDQIASANAIDRYDETTFDSGDFPKVIFRDSATDDETCGLCGKPLND